MRKSIVKELDPNHSFKDDKLPAKIASDDTVDLTKRYDIYCWEAAAQIVYRNAVIKSVLALRNDRDSDAVAQFVEVVQSNRQTILLALSSITRLCLPGTTSTG